MKLNMRKQHLFSYVFRGGPVNSISFSISGFDYYGNIWARKLDFPFLKDTLKKKRRLISGPNEKIFNYILTLYLKFVLFFISKYAIQIKFKLK